MTPRSIYQLRIALKWAKPQIWRRFLIDPTMTLADLHDVVQVVMGWEDCHLHVFVKQKRRFSVPSPWDDEWTPPGMPRDLDAGEFRIGQLLTRAKDWIDYTYDFGDNWKHRITLQKILPRNPRQRLPACISGKRRCPPEDSGGVGGYYHMLSALQDPKDRDHAHISEWMGEDFDPDEFSVDAVNRRLRRMYG